MSLRWQPACDPPLPTLAILRCREKQAALAAEDERRKAAQTAAAARFRADISGQLSEKVCDWGRGLAWRCLHADLPSVLALPFCLPPA